VIGSVAQYAVSQPEDTWRGDVIQRGEGVDGPLGDPDHQATGRVYGLQGATLEVDSSVAAFAVGFAPS
jgi:hypothetical protein